MKKRKLKKKNLLLFFFFLCSFGLVVYGCWGIGRWFFDGKKTKALEQQILKMDPVREVVDNEDILLPLNEEEIPEENPYWDYIQTRLIDVDFSELKKINSHTIGWLQVLGTNINYPFVQANDNDYYLTHAFDYSSNSAGWVFMDYRNRAQVEEKNTILYAHGRYDQTMFGSLKNILYSSWVNDTANHIVRISTEYENTLWQVFSVYRIPTTNDYIQTDFSSDEEYLTFLQMLKKRSAYFFPANVSKTDRILTLSTCYNDKEKVVLHAKLIKKENRT